MLHHFSDRNNVVNNTLFNNRVGIYLSDSNENEINGNRIIHDNENGIYLQSSSNNEIRENNVTNTNEYSLYSYYSENNNYSGNGFSNGVYVKGINEGKEYSFFINEPGYNSSVLSSLLEGNPEKPMNRISHASFLGSESNGVGSKILFMAGIIIAVLFVVFIEYSIILFRSFSGREKNAGR